DSRSVRSREAVPSAHFKQALPVLWLACAVHFPPDKALVFAVAERNPIPPLHRTGSLAVLPGILSRQSQDHEHRGLSLFAALGVLDGRIIGEGKARHRRLEFIGFLDKIDQETPDELDLH